MKKLLFCLFLPFLLSISYAQSIPHLLVFEPRFGEAGLVPGRNYSLHSSNDSVQVNTLRFYVSGIELLRKGRLVFAESNSFHLIDLDESDSWGIELTLPKGVKFDQLAFNVGIDSLTNVSGAMGGDLDPTKGMYWTWQSGYINFKLEGTSPVCPARKHRFQFHLGGYSAPYNCLQTMIGTASPGKETKIIVDLKAFLEGLDMTETYEIMSPNAKAVELSDGLRNVFRFAK